MRHFSIFAFAALAATAPAAPVISEFMASNATTLKDGHDNYEDWVEIWNPDAVAVDLLGAAVAPPLTGVRNDWRLSLPAWGIRTVRLGR